MKTFIRLTPFCLAAMLVAGCAGTRPVSDAVFGGGGAVLGGELTHGNPAGIVAGGAGGVLLSEGLHYAAKSQADKAYQTGYEKGRSDAVKQQYWLYVGLQHSRNHEDHVRLYEVHLPEQTIDGVIFKSSTRILRVEE
jgi:hypothetical protein